jgi:uncharacterized protein
MTLACRTGCGACCIAPSITQALPKMPQGKPAGVACLHLLDDFRCELFGRPERPNFCSSLKPAADMCGNDREQAIRWLGILELSTQPDLPSRVQP